MVFKINISNKEGKAYKLELESEGLIGKQLYEIIQGNELLPALEGYELEIRGATDKSGFMGHENVEGIGLSKILLPLGRGMHKRPKGDKKKTPEHNRGLRLRKTVRGRTLSPEVIQINLKVIKEGPKPLNEIFSDQSKPKEASEKTEKTE